MMGMLVIDLMTEVYLKNGNEEKLFKATIDENSFKTHAQFCVWKFKSTNWSSEQTIKQKTSN